MSLRRTIQKTPLLSSASKSIAHLKPPCKETWCEQMCSEKVAVVLGYFQLFGSSMLCLCCVHSQSLDFSQNPQMLTGSWAEYTHTAENYLRGCKW